MSPDAYGQSSCADVPCYFGLHLQHTACLDVHCSCLAVHNYIGSRHTLTKQTAKLCACCNLALGMSKDGAYLPASLNAATVNQVNQPTLQGMSSPAVKKGPAHYPGCTYSQTACPGYLLRSVLSTASDLCPPLCLPCFLPLLALMLSSSSLPSGSYSALRLALYCRCTHAYWKTLSFFPFWS